jgi:hypothetical protein
MQQTPNFFKFVLLGDMRVICALFDNWFLDSHVLLKLVFARLLWVLVRRLSGLRFSWANRFSWCMECHMSFAIIFGKEVSSSDEVEELEEEEELLDFPMKVRNLNFVLKVGK